MSSEQISALIGEAPLDALVKDCFGEPLTRKETYAVLLAASQVTMRVERAKVMHDIAFPDAVWDSRGVIGDLTWLLSAPLGRRYWELTSDGRDPEIAASGDELLRSVKPNSCQSVIEALSSDPSD